MIGRTLPVILGLLLCAGSADAGGAKNGKIQLTKPGPNAAWGSADLKIFKLKHARAQDLGRVVQDVLATPGRVVRAIPDSRTNSLIVVADPDTMPVIEALVGRLDVPVGR